MSWDESTLTLTFSYTGSETVPTSDSHDSRAETVNVCNGFTTIIDEHFSRFTSLRYLNLPDSITTLGNNFMYNTRIESLYIPLGYTIIDINQPFDNHYYIERFTIKPSHTHFTVFNDALYTKDMKGLYYYPGGKKDKVVTVPKSVETIYAAAFAYSYNIEEIILPSSVKEVYQVFGYHLESLKKVTVINCHSSNVQSEINWDTTAIFSGTDFSFNQIDWVSKNECQYIRRMERNSCHFYRNGQIIISSILHIFIMNSE